MKLISSLLNMRTPIVLLLILVAVVLFGPGLPVQAAPEGQAAYYTVQASDTWSGIAAAFGVPARAIWQANGVTNAAALSEGQRLFIPAMQSAPQGAVLTYQIPSTVAALRAAVESGNSVTEMLLLNGVTTPAAVAGQRINVPNRQGAVSAIASQGTAPEPTAAPTSLPAEPTTPPEPPTPTVEVGDAIVRSRFGVQGHFLLQDGDRRARLLDMAAYDVGFGWVKQQVPWNEFEYREDQYSDVMWEALDAVVDDAYNREMDVLLSIAKAPDWARTSTEEDGPPVDYAEYGEFVGAVVARYKYKLDAIEIWNEPNLGREWRGAPLSGAEYVRLLAVGYEAVKSAYPEGDLTVVSAGLAPTGVSDGINAIDDRTYFRQMYEAGVAQYADAIGIHPYSWANAPWLRCCSESNVPSHNNHPTFYFLDTIEDYRAIQAEFGDLGRPLWATEFGWGTMDKLNREVPPDAPFYSYVDENLQGEYILGAYRMAQQWDFMGPMFLWNFNIAAMAGFDDSQSGYSILRADDQPRRAFEMLRNVPKIES